MDGDIGWLLVASVFQLSAFECHLPPHRDGADENPAQGGAIRLRHRMCAKPPLENGEEELESESNQSGDDTVQRNPERARWVLRSQAPVTLDVSLPLRI